MTEFIQLRILLEKFFFGGVTKSKNMKAVGQSLWASLLQTTSHWSIIVTLIIASD